MTGVRGFVSSSGPFFNSDVFELIYPQLVFGCGGQFSDLEESGGCRAICTRSLSVWHSKSEKKQWQIAGETDDDCKICLAADRLTQGWSLSCPYWQARLMLVPNRSMATHVSLNSCAFHLRTCDETLRKKVGNWSFGSVLGDELWPAGVLKRTFVNGKTGTFIVLV